MVRKSENIGDIRLNATITVAQKQVYTFEIDATSIDDVKKQLPGCVTNTCKKHVLYGKDAIIEYSIEENGEYIESEEFYGIFRRNGVFDVFNVAESEENVVKNGSLICKAAIDTNVISRRE